MIILYKDNHFCELSIKRDLLGLWEVFRKSGSATWPSVYVDVFPCNNEAEAKLKLFDLEVAKRNHGFKYEPIYNYRTKISKPLQLKSVKRFVKKRNVKSANLGQNKLF